jgi:hypothetical protein
MRNLLLLVLFGQIFIGRAQSPVLPLFDSLEYGETPNAYYKDTYNDFNNFVGTWMYTNGGTSFKIVLQKKTQTYSSVNNFYRDMLVGEYQYIENGIEKVNTLSQLSLNLINVHSYGIVGNIINTAQNYPVCTNCLLNQKRIILNFKDPTTVQNGLSGEIILRRVDEGSFQKIEVWLRQTGNIMTIGDAPPAYTSFNVPWGKYILTKQP